jgi:choline dehydrogenase-like flavoprotein
MTYMRAESSQIDAWKLLGNNITWDSLLPYYQRSEGFQTPTAAQRAMGAAYDPEYHGYTGPLSVSWPNEMVGDNFSSILNETFKSIDLPWNGDANNGQMRGYNIFPKTFDRFEDKREDAARAYYFPVSERPNLDVYLNAAVQRMTWEPESHTSKPFANGVTFQTANGTETTILANREVVLSAGALMSPLLLELSGVGNKE